MVTLTTIRKSVFGATMAVALGFGAASAALATPAGAVPACNDPAANGACATRTGCQYICQQQGLDPRWAWCNTTTYCCYCDLA